MISRGARKVVKQQRGWQQPKRAVRPIGQGENCKLGGNPEQKITQVSVNIYDCGISAFSFFGHLSCG